jgi:UDP-N-acetylmuramyl tripeptide synthase
VPSGVTDDSRQVRPGDLFLAYPGDLADGRRHIAAAIAAARWPSSGRQDPAGPPISPGTATGRSPICRSRLCARCGPLAHAIYGRPSERLSLIAVTGTNGKTSVTQWIGACHPRRCAIIGTLGAGLPGQLVETGFTTPEATTLMRSLASFADDDAQACALEASSIGIAEGRLDGARVDVAVFTNLTRDHLDYHGTMEAYAQAKARLFTWPRLRLAVCNLDDPFGRELAR